MLFNSMAYAIFLPIVFALYWILPHKFRWVMLLIASYYFYMSWKPELVVLILITTAVSYTTARFIDRSSSIRMRKIFLTIGVGVSLALLFFYKYFNFFSSSIISIFRIFSLPINDFSLKVILPVGISFYTFHTLSYIIDVYRGSMKAEKHFGIYALYVSFFPQLVAGPIARPQTLLPQFYQKHTFDYNKATYGLKLMAWGFLKKIVIADTLAQYVNLVYNDLPNHKGFAFIVATVFFAFQIYCDFSGYSDIAIGSAKLMGFDLMKNFDSPYFAKSIREFWARWHISLSTWFRDYLYIPLGGNRVKYIRHLFNLFITFLVSGLWHGANWTFVIWGALHGFYSVVENIWNKLNTKKSSSIVQSRLQSRIKEISEIVITFTLVCFAWTFFRANSLSDAVYGISHMFSGILSPLGYFKTAYVSLGLSNIFIVQIGLCILTLLIFDYYQQKHDMIDEMKTWKVVIRWSVYIVLIFTNIFLMAKVNNSQFIYFRF